MQIEEQVNIERIKYLQTISLNEYIEFVSKEDNIETKTKSQREGEFKYFKNMCKDFIKANGKIMRTYQQISNRGRFYCAESIQMRPGAIRGFLMKDAGTDIDMVNCHPTILLYICNKNKILCPNLEYYVKNRNTLLKERPEIKLEVIEYINGSKSRTTNIFLKGFKQECKHIHESIFNIPEYKHHLEKAFNNKAKTNKIGTAIFSVMEDMEVEIILKVKEYLVKNKIKPAILMHDGILVYGDYYDNSQLLVEIEEIINSEHQNLGMKFSYKEHCNKIQIPDDFELNETNESRLTDKDVGEKLFEQYKHRIIKNNGVLLAYYKHTWTEDIKMVFKQWIQMSDINISGPKSEPCLVGSLTAKFENYITQLNCFCIERIDSANLLNQTKDILRFQDGYYNFATTEFKKYNDEEVLYITFKINRNFPQCVDSVVLEEIKQIVYDMFNDVDAEIDEYFSFNARALSNHIEDKVGRIVVGERNSGKGVITYLNSLAFDGVIGTVDNKELAFKKGSFESAERRNGFLKNFCDNLLCITEEVDASSKLDGTLWKTITSGGDKITYRTAYGHLAERVPLRALYSINCNKTPSFSLSDASESMILYNMPCKYVDVIPEDDCDRGFVMKVGDHNIKTKLSADKYIDAYILFVLSFYKNYRPKYPIMTEMSKENNEVEDEYVDSKDRLATTIASLYEINLIDKSTRVKCSEVHKSVLNKFPDTTPQKIKVYLMNRKVAVVKNVVNYYQGLKLKETKSEESMFT